MIERTIVVKGARLTKAELEAALAEIQTTFEPGDHVRWAKDHQSPTFVVVNTDVKAAHRAAWSHIEEYYIAVVGLHDGDAYSGPPALFEKVSKR